ncbi:MAG TPA: His/Gly/Thr/Pro-type tRNA ligase C-terminal domain-containing protein [bacterium]|nr:His/Gly/Thr/Pro-type tRNA ligase C-terminal domain-containing protein [bacterium]
MVLQYSQLFTRTKREPPSEEVSKNAQLLIQAGYIHKEMAGVYALLPLGKIVIDKIIQIIREEMVSIGGQEVVLGSLQNPEVWQTTNRWDDASIDVWFKTKLKSGTEVGLGTTHEEPLTKIMTQFISSYKDLPKYVFQFQTKFRNETRAKSGIMRTREFLMKDLYSFNRTLEEQEIFYEKAKMAYFKIFERLGLGDKTYLTFASGGAFSKYSHEFQTLCETGEDTIYLDRKRKIGINKEVLNDEVLGELKVKRNDLEEVRAVEVGNIFKLGTRFSEPLGLFFTDETGKRNPVIMGSYGIGPARAMGTVVEVLSDTKGIVWPKNISPFKVHLVGLNLEKAEVLERAKEVFSLMKSAGLEVFFDDRTDISSGEKLQDADLLGMPYRIVVSDKNKEKIELKERSSTEVTLLTVQEAINKLS